MNIWNLNEYCCFYEPEPYIQLNLNEYSKPIEYMINYNIINILNTVRKHIH